MAKTCPLRLGSRTVKRKFRSLLTLISNVNIGDRLLVLSLYFYLRVKENGWRQVISFSGFLVVLVVCFTLSLYWIFGLFMWSMVQWSIFPLSPKSNRVSDCRSFKTAKSAERLPKALPALCWLLTGEEKDVFLRARVFKDLWWENRQCFALSEKMRLFLCQNQG